jgi:hypothetical protein
VAATALWRRTPTTALAKADAATSMAD